MIHLFALLALSSFVLWQGYKYYLKLRSFVDSSITTTAKIIDVVERIREDDENHYKVYSPIVRFTVENGEEITAEVKTITTDSNAWIIGNDLKIRYVLDNLQDVRQHNLFGLWVPTLMLIGMGSVLFLMSLSGIIFELFNI